MPSDKVIELTGTDGSVTRCKLLDLVSFGGNEYGVLLTADDEEKLVVMRYETSDKESTFRTIEDDDEFERVTRFIQELARQSKK